MFVLQPPQVRDTEVFTRMPERFRRTGVGSDWADANRGGQPSSFQEIAVRCLRGARSDGESDRTEESDERSERNA